MASFWKRKPGPAAAMANHGAVTSPAAAAVTLVTEDDIHAKKNQLRSIIPKNQPIELGTINYCNLTADGRHGDYDAALRAAAQADKPLFVNFVEWSG
jgi:hypothetical protein